MNQWREGGGTDGRCVWLRRCDGRMVAMNARRGPPQRRPTRERRVAIDTTCNHCPRSDRTSKQVSADAAAINARGARWHVWVRAGMAAALGMRTWGKARQWGPRMPGSQHWAAEGPAAVGMPTTDARPHSRSRRNNISEHLLYSNTRQSTGANARKAAEEQRQSPCAGHPYRSTNRPLSANECPRGNR